MHQPGRRPRTQLLLILALSALSEDHKYHIHDGRIISDLVGRRKGMIYANLGSSSMPEVEWASDSDDDEKFWTAKARLLRRLFHRTLSPDQLQGHAQDILEKIDSISETSPDSYDQRHKIAHDLANVWLICDSLSAAIQTLPGDFWDQGEKNPDHYGKIASWLNESCEFEEWTIDAREVAEVMSSLELLIYSLDEPSQTISTSNDSIRARIVAGHQKNMSESDNFKNRRPNKRGAAARADHQLSSGCRWFYFERG